jgi:Sjoegren syndrome nuclear autoantigen 1
MSSRNEFDKIIMETEAAYSKIVESSHTLLTVLKRESASIQKRQVLR